MITVKHISKERQLKKEHSSDAGTVNINVPSLPFFIACVSSRDPVLNPLEEKTHRKCFSNSKLVSQPL